MADAKPRRIAVSALAGLALLGALASLLLARRVDDDALRAQLEASLSSALGRPVAIGAAELSPLPLPALHVRDLRVELAPGLPLHAPAARIGVSLWSLLLGRVAPSSLALRDAAVAHRRLRVQEIALAGALAGAGGGAFEFSAQSPGLGRIQQGRLKLEPGGWSAEAQLADVELAALCGQLGLPALSGTATGKLEAGGRGSAAERGALTLEANVALGSGGVQLRGPVRARIDLAGAVELELAQAELVAGAVAKPFGVPLALRGRLDAPASSLRLRELRIDSPALRAGGELDLTAGVLELEQGELELAALASWQTPKWLPANGRVAGLRAQLHFDPLAFHAEGELSDLRLPLTEKSAVRLSGRVWSDGHLLAGESLRSELAGESAALSLVYDTDAGQIELVLTAEGARAEPLAQELWGRSDLKGRLYGRVELSGPPELYALWGRGELDLRDGEIPGISLSRTAGLKTIYDDEFEELPGLDRFDSLSARFDVHGDQLEVSELSLLQRDASARVHGTLALRDLYGNFTGEAHFDFAEPSVRPILRMAGPITALETHISEGRLEIRDLELKTVEAMRAAEAAQRAGKPAAVSSGPGTSGG